MTDTIPHYEEIEDAFKVPEKVIDRLGDSIETRSARRNLDIAYAYAKQAREKIRHDEAVTSAFETRGPALAGWPWAGGTLRERDQVRLHAGDHFAHVEDGA